MIRKIMFIIDYLWTGEPKPSLFGIDKPDILVWQDKLGITPLPHEITDIISEFSYHKTPHYMGIIGVTQPKKLWRKIQNSIHVAKLVSTPNYDSQN
jgi:hypothetical protein